MQNMIICSNAEAYPVKWNISVAGGKENEVIPLVVASEQGEAQTNFLKLGLQGYSVGGTYMDGFHIIYVNACRGRTFR